MMSYKKVHFIEDKNNWIVYYCDTVQYEILNDSQKKCFDYILQGKSKQEYYDDYADSDETLYGECEEKLIDDSRAMEIPEEKLRITLNVANSCNMNCGYCYANGGTYHSKENLMSMEVAEKAIDVFAEKYGEIGSVKFIGGEPLLNKKVVCGLCDYIKKKIEDGSLKNMPDFIIATNGTILDDEIIKYSMDYNWRVGLSFDGPEVIHNTVRIFKDGSSTVKTIRDNIKRWKEATDGRCPTSVNACFSGVHQRNGVTVNDAVKYMMDELKIKKVNIVPVDASKDSSFALIDDNCFINAIKDTLSTDSVDYRKYMFTKLRRLEKMLRGHYCVSRHICKAGLTTFGVSTKGVISPCHMLTDENGFYMGSVFDENPLSSEVFEQVQSELNKYSRYEDEICKDCFANRLCIGCLGGNLFRTGDPYHSDPSVCKMIRGTIEELIKDILKD